MRTRERSTFGRVSVRNLGILLLVGALAASAGCIGVLDDGGGDDPIEHVPADQNAVVEVDADVIGDETTWQLLAAGNEEESEVPTEAELDDVFASAEAEAGLDPRDVERVLLFGQTDEAVQDVDDPVEAAQGDDERVGFVVETDWQRENVSRALEELGETTLTEASYDPQQGVLYRVTESDDDPAYLGALGGGTFVFGDEASVRGSLDTEYAGADSLGGDLRDAYENTRDGLVTVAVALPEEQQGSTGSELGEFNAMTGVYYTDGGTVGVEGRLALGSESDAREISGGLTMRLAGYQDDPALDERTRRLLGNVEFSQDGSDVVVTYESAVETLIEAAESQ